MISAPIELLSGLERPDRAPIDRMARGVWRRLEQTGLDPRQAAPEAVAAAYNLAALVETHHGRPEAARRLCRAAIGWIEVAAAARRDDGLRALALQPAINLARLTRIAGDPGAAARRLAALARAARRGAAWAGPPAVTQSHWAAMRRARPELPAFLARVAAFEALTAALRADRPRAIARLEQAAATSADLSRAVAVVEARWIADARGAAVRPPTAARAPAGLGELALHALLLRRHALNLAQGRDVAASCEQLARLARGRLAAPPEGWRLALAQHAVAALGDRRPDLAGALAALGWRAARAMGDEVFEAWFAGAAAAADEAAGRDAAVWRGRRAALAERSRYAALRAAAGLGAPPPVPALDAVAERLVRAAPEAAS